MGIVAAVVGTGVSSPRRSQRSSTCSKSTLQACGKPVQNAFLICLGQSGCMTSLLQGIGGNCYRCKCATLLYLDLTNQLAVGGNRGETAQLRKLCKTWG